MDEPTPTRVPKAVLRFISGKVTPRADMASAPTPSIWPMKMLSTILYSEDAVIAMMPGIAYFASSLLIFSVPSSVGAVPLFVFRLICKLQFEINRAETRNIGT